MTPIIGLEIHIVVKTASKLFCSCANREGDPPNTNVCPICLGYPGTMPSLNQEAVVKAIKMGMALRCSISEETWWERKSYMYPDLFKGYQISQYRNPICSEGYADVIVKSRKDYYKKPSEYKKVGVFRVQLEEDAAKSLHFDDVTILDANKAGVALLEIVSKPEMYSVDEAVSFAKTVRNLARWYDISDCDLELGQMRFDVNISICVSDIQISNMRYEEWRDQIAYTPIVEIKNLNSFKSLELSLEYEINRQISEYKKTGELYRPGYKETRGWDEERLVTYSQRKKEEADEYRYMPEPDIPILIITSQDKEEILNTLEDHPYEVREELISIGIPEQTVDIIVSDRNLYSLYKEVVGSYKNIAKKVAHILTNELAEEAARSDLLEERQSWASGLREIILKVQQGHISNAEFKELIRLHEKFKNDWNGLLKEYISQEENFNIEDILREAIKNNEKVVQDIKKGKESAKMFFVGIVMKQTKGHANPRMVLELLDKILNE